MADRKWEDAIQKALRIDPVTAMREEVRSGRRCTHISRTSRMLAASVLRMGT